MLNFCGNHTKQLMPHYVLSLQLCVLIGFVLTFFIHPSDIVNILISFGAVVIACGLLGAFFNQNSDKLGIYT